MAYVVGNARGYSHAAAHPTSHRPGFTLIELLVVIGIVVLLIGILFPVFRSVRRAGRDTMCASNMRQIAIALISYAGQNKGSFPPNSGESGQFWYLEPVINRYIAAPDRVGRAGAIPPGADPSAGLAGGVFRCPNDLDDAVRSYSMNLFASGEVSSHVTKKLESASPPGRMFKYGAAADSSRLLLLLETWPELPVKGSKPPVYVAQAIVGLVGKPGERFGGGKGIVWTTPPDATPGRFDVRASQITFYRHSRQGNKTMEDPKGRANFAFADGHVAMLDQRELVGEHGLSSYLALWSPVDREVETPSDPSH